MIFRPVQSCQLFNIPHCRVNLSPTSSTDRHNGRKHPQQWIRELCSLTRLRVTHPCKCALLTARVSRAEVASCGKTRSYRKGDHECR